MFEMQAVYDQVCERAARFKDEESHLQDLQRRTSGSSKAPEEFVSKEILRRK
jgi:hypothetical protein